MSGLGTSLPKCTQATFNPLANWGRQVPADASGRLALVDAEVELPAVLPPLPLPLDAGPLELVAEPEAVIDPD